MHEPTVIYRSPRSWAWGREALTYLKALLCASSFDGLKSRKFLWSGQRRSNGERRMDMIPHPPGKVREHVVPVWGVFIFAWASPLPSYLTGQCESLNPWDGNESDSRAFLFFHIIIFPSRGVRRKFVNSYSANYQRFNHPNTIDYSITPRVTVLTSS